MKFSNLYPWQLTAGEVEAFFDDLRRGRRPVMVSTAASCSNAAGAAAAFMAVTSPCNARPLGGIATCPAPPDSDTTFL